MSVGVSAVMRRIAAGVDGPPFHFSFLWELMTATEVRACFLIYGVFCLLLFALSQNDISDTKAQRGLGFTLDTHQICCSQLSAQKLRLRPPHFLKGCGVFFVFCFFF